MHHRKDRFLEKGYPKEEPFWALPVEKLYQRYATNPTGLTASEARERLRKWGRNQAIEDSKHTLGSLFLKQFRSPLILILITAATTSGFLYDWVNAIIILAIVVSSIIINMKQEHNALQAVEKLKSLIAVRSKVWRDGDLVEEKVENLVPGDILQLTAGSMVPGDGRIIESTDLFVNQAALTGESFPVEKKAGLNDAEKPIQDITNAVFMGSSVRSGTATILLTRTGLKTKFGRITRRLQQEMPENDFEKGIRTFSYLLTRIILVLVILVFGINLIDEKSPVESLLFAIALAVGMTPELLPVIITVTLSHGARKMAEKGVIVKKLNAIETLGSMSVLCTDKTGTLTAGVIQLDQATDADGVASGEVERLALTNALFQQGLPNPLDEALIQHARHKAIRFETLAKTGEIPYDFIRKRLTVIMSDSRQPDSVHLISKGAFQQVLSICTNTSDKGTIVPMDKEKKRLLNRRFRDWSNQGYRVLGVATKTVPAKEEKSYSKEDEQDFTFRGFLLFYDPPKQDVIDTLKDLTNRGVGIKILTGDNRYVTQHLASQVGLSNKAMITGEQLRSVKQEALAMITHDNVLFTELDPQQKEQIIRALKKSGEVVGFLGDGINDATALYEADVGISVDSAVDVAKDSADFVLMEHNLSVLHDGIDEGRRTFNNTMKYILTTSSANFGNMISMALASAFLPFLPLLAKQILLNNFLSDIPGLSLAADRVDNETVKTPQRWSVRSIRNFMILFGLTSTIFDVLTFLVLLNFFGAGTAEFRTAWFIESLLTEVIIIFVIRTKRPFYASRPGRWLIPNAVAVLLVSVALPYLPVNTLLGFVPLSATLMGGIIAISILYALTTESIKHRYYALQPG